MNKEQDELVGKVIDGYKILELKGQGRYCKVYKAKDEDFEHSFVAVKAVEPEEEPVLREEAKVLDKLQGCDNIPRIYKYENGKLIMEYFDNSLRDILDKKGEYLANSNIIDKKIDWRDAVKVAIDVLKALEYAHSKKQIHRDIKPSNILTDGKKYVLNDFNFAKSLIDSVQKEKGQGKLELSGDMEEVSAGKARLSCIGGTKGYQAPEQIIGTSKDTDERTDIYSLSAVLYEMITGKLPLGNYDVPRNIPVWLSSVLKTGLAQNKQSRFQNANEMKKWLVNGLEGRLDEKEPDDLNKAISEAFAWIGDKLKKVGMFALMSPWYIAKYTIFAPITLTAYLAKECDKVCSDDPLVGLAVLTGLLSLGLYIGLAIGIPMHLMHQSRVHELQNSDRKGKIAYVLQGHEIRYYDASKMLEENKEEIRLCPKDVSSISDLVWSADGKKLYFTGTYSGAPVVNAGITSIPSARQIFSIDLEGKQEIISPIETEYQLHKTELLEGKEVVYMKKGTEFYSFDIATKKIERVAKVTQEIEEPQTVSPDKKYSLYGSMYDDVKGITIKKDSKEIKKVSEDGFNPAWWHKGE